MNFMERLPLLKNYFSRQVSSYDIDGGNGDGLFWKYGDEAANNFKDRVLLDTKGSGRIVRIWAVSWGEDSRIRFFLDGEETASIDMPVSELFVNRDGNPFPLAGDGDVSSGGCYTYVEIPFKKGIKVTADGINFYHIQYRLDEEVGAAYSVGDVDEEKQRLLCDFMEGKNILKYSAKDNFKDISLKTPFTYTLSGRKCIASIRMKLKDVYPITVGKKSELTDRGRVHKGVSSFTAKLDPDNQGVRVMRRLDYGLQNQSAKVYVDGEYAGIWRTHGMCHIFRWKDDCFDIPKELTANKDKIRLSFAYYEPEDLNKPDGFFVDEKVYGYSEFYYTVECKDKSGNYKAVCVLDAGNKSSENSRDYTLEGDIVKGGPADKDSEYVRKYSYRGKNSVTPKEQKHIEDILNRTELSVYYDGNSEPSIKTPISMFFGFGKFGSYSTAAISYGIDDGGELYFNIPMPFEENIKICVSSEAGAEIEYLDVYYRENGYEKGKYGYLKGAYNVCYPTEIGKCIPLLKTEGFGHMVSVVESVEGMMSRGFLEGDERIYIDGKRSFDIHGTGTEDFFNGAYYFCNDLFSLPFHGMPSHDKTDNDRTSMYRFLTDDKIVFRKEIEAYIEHGGGNETRTYADVLTLYYHSEKTAMSLTDEILPSSENSEKYECVSGTKLCLERGFEQEYSDVKMSADGFEDMASSEMKINIARENDGIIIRGLFDNKLKNALSAEVYADGVLTGIWQPALNSGAEAWREDDYFIRKDFTASKTTACIKIKPLTKWQDLKYEIYSLRAD